MIYPGPVSLQWFGTPRFSANFSSSSVYTGIIGSIFAVLFFAFIVHSPVFPPSSLPSSHRSPFTAVSSQQTEVHWLDAADDFLCVQHLTSRSSSSGWANLGSRQSSDQGIDVENGVIDDVTWSLQLTRHLCWRALENLTSSPRSTRPSESPPAPGESIGALSVASKERMIMWRWVIVDGWWGLSSLCPTRSCGCTRTAHHPVAIDDIHVAEEVLSFLISITADTCLSMIAGNVCFVIRSSCITTATSINMDHWCILTWTSTKDRVQRNLVAHYPGEYLERDSLLVLQMCNNLQEVKGAKGE